VNPHPSFPERFQPEVFFLGRTIGAGEIRGPGGKLLKRCLIETSGAPDPEAGGMHFDETYTFDDGTKDSMHWSLSRDAAGELHVSELSVVGTPRLSLDGPTWRIRFKRIGGPVPGATLTYDATFTWATSDMVIKRTKVKLFGITVATLTAFHRRIAGTWLPATAAA